MKEKIAQLIKFISHWKAVLLEQAKRYGDEWSQKRVAYEAGGGSSLLD